MDSITAGASTNDHVVENLYMGGGWLPIETMRRFDAICLCADEVAPSTSDLVGRSVVRCWLRDCKPKGSELNRARVAADYVARHITAGSRVLVTCLGGLNRSGLVVGLALRELGYDAEEAIRLVRAARGPFALSNKHFVEVIRDQ